MDVPLPDAPPSNITRPDLVGVQYAAKWDLLQPYIARLYFEEKKSLADLRQTVKVEFGFDA